MGRSRSRSSSSRSRSRSPDGSRAKKSPGKYEMDNECKIYIGGLRRDSDEKELERVFGRYGQVQDVWVARSPPGFGFVELDDRDDAADAIRDLDGTMMCGVKVRVSHSCSRKNLPSVKGSRKPFDVRCYECGEFGHYAYECRERAMRLRRPRSESRSRSRSPRHRSRSPYGISRRRGRFHSRSRSGSRGRRDRSRSGSEPRLKKEKKSRKKSRSRSVSPVDSDDGRQNKKNYRKKHDSDSETESPRKKEKRDRKTSGDFEQRYVLEDLA